MSENNDKSQAALREEAILKFWKENDIFNKSLVKNKGGKEYVFYEGPPTANGKPGIHHLEARAFKDVIPRYKTMRGYHVRRKGGWDTHGLPVELQVEKKLGLSSKKAIEDYGIAKFNQECKESVWEYLKYWNEFTERIGYWIDQKNPYVTYHNDYIESVWNVIKEADNKKLLYKDYKVVPWCPRCGTALSSHELAQGYEDVKDLSVYVKFKLKPGQKYGEGKETKDSAYIIAWTTTPWTLPGNVALAVGNDVSYTALRVVGLTELYIVASARVENVFRDQRIEIVHKDIKGKDLIGLEYEPLYPYLKNQLEEKKEDISKAFKVYEADFVTTEDGTGVVHTAVMYGQDDFDLGTEIGLPKHHLVSLDGKFLPGTDFLEGRFVRDEETAVEIIKDLAHRNLLLKKEKYEHSYPHCWRCHTALIYYARDSWYIRMTELRDKMIKENEGINWEPAYIKEGRFGEWLRDIKDWAISRERYWGTPLPVWKCNQCEKIKVIGSIDDLKSKTKKSGNRYFIMRHGEAEHNLLDVFNSEHKTKPRLTEKGKNQVKESIKNFKNIKFDLIFSSPFVRGRETAEIVKKEINSKNEIIFDDRIQELNSGDYEGKKVTECYERLSVGEIEKLDLKFPNGESHNNVRKRVGDFLYDLDLKYNGKNILIVSHGDPTWLSQAIGQGLDKEKTISLKSGYLKNAEIRELNFSLLPHNENYELDLHKPYIDEISLMCDCGGELIRTKEVMDVWLDSGSMPFAQDHYPFDGDIKYPADFISEAIDQTRGWFYTLHAVGAIMGRGKAYKNVICLGHLLDQNGKKMSKSLGNVVDPWEMMNKYSADTIRLWMYSVNQPGESKNFDEKTVGELHNKVFNLLYNVLAFYELYRDEKIENNNLTPSPLSLIRRGDGERSNILDRWVLARLNKLVEEVTDNLDNYKLLEPVRAIRDFIDVLSTWYVRRSRERIKNGDIQAKITLYYVLKTLAKLMAPFTPFASEDIWQKLKNDRDEESVHLAKWPIEKKPIILKFILKKINPANNKILDEMEQTRKVVTLGLQARQKAGLPVRQPLNKLQIANFKLRIEYRDIIKDELNVKEVKTEEGQDLNVELDTNITPELREEGMYRELIRVIQDFRKISKLTPSDIVTFGIETNDYGQKFVNKFKENLLKVVGAKDIKFVSVEGPDLKIDNFVFKLKLEK